MQSPILIIRLWISKRSSTLQVQLQMYTIVDLKEWPIKVHFIVSMKLHLKHLWCDIIATFDKKFKSFLFQKEFKSLKKPWKNKGPISWKQIRYNPSFFCIQRFLYWFLKVQNVEFFFNLPKVALYWGILWNSFVEIFLGVFVQRIRRNLMSWRV